jgi:thiamine pyridinylase
MKRFRLLLLALATGATLCGGATQAQTPLRVALFPYLPDVGRDTLASMARRIEAEFEAANPGIDLQLRRMDPDDGAFYEPDSLRAWLTAPAGQGYDLVEVDAIMLGDLAAAGYLTPWAAADSSDWNNAALPALTYGGVLYGIPHWLCGDFILTRFPSVHAAETVDELQAALAQASANQVKLSGALGGSWTLPALYLHAWGDTHGTQGMAGAITPALDSAVVAEMEEVFDFCELGAVNVCLDKDVYTPDSSVAIYASGRSDAFLGFSERLTAIMMAGADGSQVRISPAPLGPRNTPVLYVDALTLRRGCDTACQEAASAFSRYLLDPRTYGWMLMSRDAPQGAPPRYLLPATWSAFGQVLQDPHFRDMLVAIHGAVPLPNTGFAASRKAMQAALLRALH